MMMWLGLIGLTVWLGLLEWCHWGWMPVHPLTHFCVGLCPVNEAMGGDLHDFFLVICTISSCTSQRNHFNQSTHSLAQRVSCQLFRPRKTGAQILQVLTHLNQSFERAFLFPNWETRVLKNFCLSPTQPIDVAPWIWWVFKLNLNHSSRLIKSHQNAICSQQTLGHSSSSLLPKKIQSNPLMVLTCNTITSPSSMLVLIVVLAKTFLVLVSCRDNWSSGPFILLFVEFWSWDDVQCLLAILRNVELVIFTNLTWMLSWYVTGRPYASDQNRLHLGLVERCTEP